jgi:hypothetical protein
MQQQKSSGRILGRNPDKSPSHLYSFAARFLSLQTHATSDSFYKGERGKTDRKPYPLPYGLRNPYRKLKSENFQDYAQKPVLDKPYSQLTPLSGVAVQARQST